MESSNHVQQGVPVRQLLFLLSFLFLNAALADDTTYQYELRNAAHGGQELWFFHPTYKEDMKIGVVETWKKGMKLFHWANATPEQAQSWNDSGKIPASVLENLKVHNIGAAGGGFYASTTLTDSMHYGNTLVIVTLPKDMRVLRTVSATGVNVAAHARELEKMKFSAITVSHTRTWVNVVDVNMLTQEFVADENFFRNYRFEQLPKPESLGKLFQRFPNLRQEHYYKDLYAEVKQLERDFKSTNREVAHAAALKLFDKADFQFKRDLLTDMRPTYVNEEIMNKAISMMNIEDHLFGVAHGIIYAASKKKELRYKAYRALITSSAPPLSMPSMLRGISQRDASNLLSEALEVHGENMPKHLQNFINDMKRAGTWNPDVMMCSKIFAS